MLRATLCTLLAAVLLTTTAFAQSRDKVYYRDRAAKPERTADVEGTIVEETVNAVTIKQQVGPDRTIPVADIVDVAYAVPTAMQIPYQNTIAGPESMLRTGTADKARISQLIKDYNTFLSNLKDPKAVGLRRHIAYRIAMLKTDLAKTREEQLDALNHLERARKEVASSWQLVPVTRRQVQLLADTEKFDEANRVLEEVTKTPDLAKELRQDLELTLIDIAIRSGKAAAVEGRIAEALTVLPPTDPQALRLKVYQVGAQALRGGDTPKLIAQLTTMIEQSQDAGLKALAYNTLGDIYAGKGQKKDAMWAYLWVDVVYNQDRGEHAKAVDRLTRVFTDLNDDDRAARYKEKLQSLR